MSADYRSLRCGHMRRAARCTLSRGHDGAHTYGVEGDVFDPAPLGTTNRLGERVIEMHAWIGEDEMGSGRVGIKQGRVPAGYIPLCAMDYDREKLARLAPQMQAQADTYGKTIRLARFLFIEDEITLTPRTRG